LGAHGYVTVKTVIGLVAYEPLALFTQNATKSYIPVGMFGTVAATLKAPAEFVVKVVASFHVPVWCGYLYRMYIVCGVVVPAVSCPLIVSGWPLGTVVGFRFKVNVGVAITV
jgi:hypothetical protein